MKLNINDLNNSLIVCPKSYSRQLLQSISDSKVIIDVKFMDLNEYKRNYYFDYDVKAIKYLVDKHNLSINNAKEILNNLYYIDTDKSSNNKKLSELQTIKKELIKNNLLIFNPLFEKQIKDRKVLIAGYGKLKKEDLEIINGELVEDELIDKKYNVYSFENIEDEVEYLYNSIFDLLYEKNIDINKIFILNNNQDYNSYFKRFNTYYPFVLDFKNKDNLLGSKLANDFIKMIDENSKEEIYEYLSSINNELSKRIINIMNRYPEYELKDVKEYLIHDLRNSKVNNVNLKNVVKCVDYDYVFEKEDHVFLIGFNEQIPQLKKDDDYLSDDLKRIINISDSNTINILRRHNTKVYLSNIDNLYLSYSKKSPFNTYNTNNLFDDVNYLDYKKSYDYSDKLNKLKYIYDLDKYYKYNVKQEDLPLLNKYYEGNDYSTYNNSFNGLDDRQIKDIDKVSLSYSSMEEFYKCQFKYYLQYVLGLYENDDNFNTKLGSVCHDVLKKYYEDDSFDFDEAWNESLSSYKMQDKKEEFFLNKIKQELKTDIEIINTQDNLSKLNKHLCEERFKYDLNDSISFKGFIDKLNYLQQQDETVVSVVDYKTGNYASIKEKNFPYGLSLQLPSYMYLLSKDERFKNIKYGGFYLQHLVNSDLKYNSEKDLKTIKEESMRLRGYTSKDVDRASLLDEGIYEGNSFNISGLKLKKDGTFSENSKTMSDEEFEELVSLVDTKILEAGEKILKGDFVINPKEIDKENVSCEYCPYSDVCYKRNDDLVFINTKKEKEE